MTEPHHLVYKILVNGIMFNSCIKFNYWDNVKYNFCNNDEYDIVTLWLKY